MSEPFEYEVAASAISRWEGLRPVDAEPGYVVGDSDQRAGFVSGLRELADFLEDHTDIPVPAARETTLSVFVDGTVPERRAQVEYAGELLGGPVTDHTTLGGHLFAQRHFGPVTFEVAAAGIGAAFRTGQDVWLAPEQAEAAGVAGRAVAGTVTGIERQEDGTFTYAVHFPGVAGDQRGLAAGSLRETEESPAVRLWNGSQGSGFSIKEAEELFIEAWAANSPGTGPDPGALLVGLASACEMAIPDLIEQLRPKAEQRKQELHAGKHEHPAALAANDIAGLSISGVSLSPAASEEAPVPTPPQQHASRPRP